MVLGFLVATSPFSVLEYAFRKTFHFPSVFRPTSRLASFSDFLESQVQHPSKPSSQLGRTFSQPRWLFTETVLVAVVIRQQTFQRFEVVAMHHEIVVQTHLVREASGPD